jgi:glycosyltransferase domain-containing protein
MSDFTLVIPTFNRPCELNALLRYLAAHEVPWKIIVLDSGLIATMPDTHDGLDVTIYRYSQDTHPFDKFRLGLQHVTTEFCALLADDDMYIPSAIDACVQALKDNSQAVMAAGQTFSYDDTLAIGAPALKVTSIKDADPFMRLARLFERYHALTYGVYRTAALQQILTTACAVPSILTRELLASGLAAIEGEIVYVPLFAHGRSCGVPAQRYHNCHPTNWMLEDADGMFAEYVRFRDILVEQLVAAGDQEDWRCIKDRLNLIFLCYLQATANVSYSVGGDNIHVKFEDRINDDGVPAYTLEEMGELSHAMRHYEL